MPKLELDDLKKLHDKAYTYSQVTRERAADDLVFYWVTNWDDNLLSESQLQYRGEFNIIRKAGRQILSDLSSNPVQVDFDPINETREDSADILDGIYMSCDNQNISKEAFSNAQQEAVVCGVGGWELYADYISTRTGNKDQVIKRKPIYEANNTVLWDPNAKLLDKSDAKYVSILSAYSEDGYKDLVFDLTGEEVPDNYQDSFKNPEQSYTFPWMGAEGKKIYVTNFYYREKVKEKILIMEDPFGQTRMVREADLVDVMDEMIDAGFEVESEKEIERWEITKYIASGSEILATFKIAGEHIPVVPAYGEHAYVEGEEHYEGVTRLAKDPQRLRNFQMSYLADIVSRSPRNKPIFFQEQIAGFEDMYSESGADNNYPYMLQNRKSGDGSDLPIGPVAQMPEQTMPQALIASIALSREAVADVANPGVPQDVADPDLSGKAVLALQSRMDQQSTVYQENFKHAKRRDGEIFASMASEVYDVPRKVKITLQDGSMKEAQVMETIIDEETGDIVTINDLSNAEFEVYSKIGPSYTSKKEQTIDRLTAIHQAMNPADPMYQPIMLKIFELMDGVNFDDVREYARKQLLLSGIREPETDEDKMLLEQHAAAGQQPSAEMVLAMAEDKKGQAALMKEQREGLKLNFDIQDQQADNQVDAFKAQTDRMGVQVRAQEAGANIDYKRVDTLGKQIDNIAKAKELRQPKEMSNDELLEQLYAG
jgi:hypothetical protein